MLYILSTACLDAKLIFRVTPTFFLYATDSRSEGIGIFKIYKPVSSPEQAFLTFAQISILRPPGLSRRLGNRSKTKKSTKIAKDDFPPRLRF